MPNRRETRPRVDYTHPQPGRTPRRVQSFVLWAIISVVVLAVFLLTVGLLFNAMS